MFFHFRRSLAIGLSSSGSLGGGLFSEVGGSAMMYLSVFFLVLDFAAAFLLALKTFLALSVFSSFSLRLLSFSWVVGELLLLEQLVVLHLRACSSVFPSPCRSLILYVLWLSLCFLALAFGCGAG